MINENIEAPAISRGMRRSWLSFGISVVAHLILFLMLTLGLYTVKQSGLIVLEATSQAELDDFENESPATIEMDVPLDAIETNAQALEASMQANEPAPPEMTVDWSGMLADAAGGPPISDADENLFQNSETGGFFGIEATGDRVVYIIDMSPSMSQGYRQRRFDRAVDEVMNSVNELRDDQTFFVYLFCFESREMEIGGSQTFCYPTASNKLALEKWLRSIVLGPGTDPREALVAALKMDPTCIFLLSDGEFNGKRYGTGKYGRTVTAVSLARKYNKSKCPINTIGLEDRGSQDDMTQIAKQSNGRYKFIPAAIEDSGLRP